MNRIYLLQSIIDKLQFKTYLEIGCARGATISRLQNLTHAVGIDPSIQSVIHEKLYLINITSDAYFKLRNPKNNSIDLIFVDGMHRYEQVIKDVKNSLNCLSDNGIIVLHDCNPPTAEAAQEGFSCGRLTEWCGDIWKIVLTYSDMFVIDDDYGMGILSKCEPMEYDPKIYKMAYSKIEQDKKKILKLKTVEYFEEWLDKRLGGKKYDRRSSKRII